MKPSPTIITDSREQCPLVFANIPTMTGTLATGDYSVAGLEHLVCVERKSLDDLLGCCGQDRARFKRELQRLRAYRYRLLVIEADAATLAAGDWRSKLTPAHVLGSLAAWQAQFGLPVWLAGDATGAAGFVERYLYQVARSIMADLGCAAAFAGMAETEAVQVA